MISGDPRLVAEAYGRMAAGVSFTTTGLYLANQGLITGRGPSTPRQRKALEASGWLPYSIKTPNGYLQYQRLDPFATLLGLWADMADYGRYASAGDQSALESMVTAFSVATANNFTNKTCMTGLRNFVDAITDPEHRMERFFQRYASTLVLNVAGQAVGVSDDSLREVRTWLDAVVSKIPGLSETLAPQRNILGEPVERIESVGADGLGKILNWIGPLAYREVTDDVIHKELALLGHGWSPPKITQRGLDLTTFKNAKGQDAYDRWMELQGSVRIGTKSLRMALKDRIESSTYQRLPVESLGEVESPRVGIINRIVSRFRRAAFRELRQEFPELVEAEQEIYRAKREARYGVGRARLPLFER